MKRKVSCKVGREQDIYVVAQRSKITQPRLQLSTQDGSFATCADVVEAPIHFDLVAKSNGKRTPCASIALTSCIWQICTVIGVRGLSCGTGIQQYERGGYFLRAVLHPDSTCPRRESRCEHRAMCMADLLDLREPEIKRHEELKGLCISTALLRHGSFFPVSCLMLGTLPARLCLW